MQLTPPGAFQGRNFYSVKKSSLPLLCSSAQFGSYSRCQETSDRLPAGLENDSEKKREWILALKDCLVVKLKYLSENRK